MKHPAPRIVLALALTVSLLAAALPAAVPALKISDNHRYLTKENGEPFFWLGDTAWELFHRLNREEADAYLENRARQGFTVIQAVALAELDGLHTPNRYGHFPLQDDDPTRPAVGPGPADDYWDHVDYIIQRANALGLVVALLPTWGDKWHKANQWAVGPEVFTPENAEIYGRWLGERYKDAGIVWVLGGDRAVKTDLHRAILERLAAGLGAGDGGRHLRTFHPDGNHGSTDYFPAAGWIDFNFRQNGHSPDFNGHYQKTRTDYDRTPVKPVIDGEPLYEDHPVNFRQKESGHSIAADVRRPLYWNLFSGACGHTYGHHSVWQMWSPERPPINDPLLPWTEALDQPGAGQMQFARWLLESRPFLTRVPDQSVIVTDRVASAVPGTGRYHFAATRDTEGTYAMVYAPVGRTFRVQMDVIKGTAVKAWWFNPRDGTATLAGTFEPKGQRAFTPPDKGEMIDWILVLDDAGRNYPAPGTRR